MEKILELLKQMEGDVEEYIELQNKEKEKIVTEKVILVTKIMIKHMEIYGEMKKIVEKETVKLEGGEA